MTQSHLNSAVAKLRPLLDTEDATQGMRVQVRRGAIVLSRPWLPEDGAEPAPDPRFRLTPHGAGIFGLSLYRLNRWERLPFMGTLEELVDVMNSVLAHWAT